MFIATAKCQNEGELINVLGRLACIQNASVETQGLDIAVMYEPADYETSREEEETIAKLTDIFDSIPTHCIISQTTPLEYSGVFLMVGSMSFRLLWFSKCGCSIDLRHLERLYYYYYYLSSFLYLHCTYNPQLYVAVIF